MSDIAINFNEITSNFDINFIDGDFEVDDGLETAVFISLFTDRRASEDDILPFSTSGRRGWWGDSLSEITDDKIGSKLWLLEREFVSNDVLVRAKEYSEQALQWMVDDGVADRIEVETQTINTNVLAIGIEIYRGNELLESFNFPFNLSYQSNWDALQ